MKRRITMICKKCGNEVKDGEIVCPKCGAAVRENGAYEASYADQQGRNEISSARTLGIVSIITGILGIALAGWICGGIGLSKSKRWMFTNDTFLLAEARKAKKLNVIGLVLSTIVFVVYLVIVIMSIAASFAMLGAM